MVTQSPNTQTEELLGRLKDALAGTHGRAFSADAVRTLVSLEVAEWKDDCRPEESAAETVRAEAPLINHRIRLSSE
ncbi:MULTISPECIES: hypothetical protein [Rhizobium]|uniref:Uncharacterized protein n=1 Tax=Rhizobium wuzhouense TaxID=1986026 RepID=A0ABX5NPQ2_9HYPH|nr:MULTISPECIES: hypothetical protein [Rhizobium]PYB72481.1 hypothetical protein DMY87_15245 [Rhizobium wuzhouense]RKE83464.1 hypothetical protein DFO46_0216 [Rhizobium sp. AG855]